MTNTPIVIVSGGFDPLHSGHLNLFSSASTVGDLIVAVNSDQWLINKKGRRLLPFYERRLIISELSDVEDTVAFDDSDGTACDAIQQVVDRFPNRKIIFANGGDRDLNNVPEANLCRELGAELYFAVGGDKVASSSDFLADYVSLETESRQWGHYEVLSEGPGYKVKKLIINPHCGTSLQRHFKRAEVWTVVSGEATVVNGSRTYKLNKREHVRIDTQSVHQIQNNTDQQLVLIEVQTGELLVEDDIERL